MFGFRYLPPPVFEYESANWATGPQAQTIDELADCFSAGSVGIVSNDDEHSQWDFSREGIVVVEARNGWKGVWWHCINSADGESAKGNPSLQK